MADYRLEFINRKAPLDNLADALIAVPVIALDIETVEWWSRAREKVALIQLAYRTNGAIKVAIIDALAGLDLKVLRQPLESKNLTKAIHNAAFDATKLFVHYGFHIAPVFDTMIAARRSGEKKYSLATQAAAHLKIYLDKSSRQSDWSRRPLDLKQLDYAARDAYATLLLYEHQTKRNLVGNYYLKGKSPQEVLPLEVLPDVSKLPAAIDNPTESKRLSGNESTELPEIARAFLGIISQLPSRYGPEQLIASVGAENRVGLAGWIIDRTIGTETDIDEETAKLVIADLCERKLINLTESRRLETSEQGHSLWQQLKEK